jgi:Uma2 family endonuclease
MATVQAPAVPQHLRMDGIDWKTYTRLLRIFAERPGYRLTYDRGRLEIMSPVLGHDRYGRFLGRMIVALTEELRLPILSGGTTTLRRQLKRRGLEPDECFWIANEARVRGLSRLNLRRDPPPDLAVEIDTTRSSLNRMGIYAALGVPEVWRLDGTSLTFQVLAGKSYQGATVSRTFPRVAPADLTPFLASLVTTEENEMIRQFRDWVRQNLIPTPPAPTA